jgi:hypothetical protein
VAVKFFKNLTKKEQAIEQPVRVAHRSLALGEFESFFSAGRSYRVLDLGRPCESTVRFFSQFSRQVYCEDLSVSTVSSDPTKNRNLFSDLLDGQEGAQFDLILTWDLFNYLTPNELKEFSEKIAPFTNSDTRIYSIICTKSEMPENPQYFRVHASGEIYYDVVSPVTVPCPRYTKLDVQRFLPNFNRARSYLLKNGMEEHIFTPLMSIYAAPLSA